MAENRRRSETLTARLTKAEKAVIIAKSKKAKMTLTEYILAISKDAKIVLPPDTAPIVLELKRIGNNLNQIAAKVNSGVTYVENLTEVIENQNKIYDLLLKLTEECRWQRQLLFPKQSSRSVQCAALSITVCRTLKSVTNKAVADLLAV